jgi:hypothetical protein
MVALVQTTPFRDGEDDTSDSVVHTVPGTVGGDGCDTAAVGDALTATRGHGEFAFFDYRLLSRRKLFFAPLRFRFCLRFFFFL